jgi:hypothetical protein
LTIAATNASAALLRSSTGAIEFDRGGPAPPQPKPAHPSQTLDHLRQITLRQVSATLTDAATRTVWRLTATTLDLAHLDTQATTGAASLTLASGPQTTQIAAQLTPYGTTRRLTLTWSALNPALLPPPIQIPADLPVAGAAAATLTQSWTPLAATIRLALGHGRLHLDAGALPVDAGAATLAIDLRTRKASLTQTSLTLPQAGGQTPHLTASGTAAASADFPPARATATLSLALDHLSVPALAQYWPEGFARGARAWVTTNLTAGTVTAAHAELTLADTHGALTLASAHGTLAAHDATLAWLAPVPPLTHADATLTLLSPDALLVTIPHATQTPSDPTTPPLTLSHATLRITGLSARDQIALVDTDLAGPVPQALALLSAPRLHLLAQHKIDLGAPTGTIATHLNVQIPLDTGVTIDRIALHATGHLAALHLGGVIAGRDLDHGEIALDATTKGLSLTGTATVATIPAQLAVTMDFRAGPPSQVLTTYRAQGEATAAQLSAAHLPTAQFVTGAVGYTTTVIERRDNTGQVTVQLDLHDTGLALAPLGWRKPPGTAGAANAVILLDHDRIAGIDQLSATAPDLAIAGAANFTAGQPDTFTLTRLEVGATRAAGTLRFPTSKDPALAATLHGAVLDLRPLLAPGEKHATPSRKQAEANATTRRAAAAAAAAPQRGPAWRANLTFDQVLLGPSHRLTRVAAHAENDGLLTQRARVTGQAGAGAFRISLTPHGATRDLSGTAQDAGALLQALDLTSAVHGGTLTLDAQFNDRLAGHPLVGQAEADTIRVVGATALARLLQAMTLYGLVDVLRGPGLGITRLIAPFHFANDVLSLKNARAYSASLGFTAKGDIDLAAQRADLSGTIVPGYVFNTMLGKLPILGKLFSPEKGGGLFAATYTLSGPLASPKVAVNPLAALTPGFLRGIFGDLGQK